ncbi:hypothetical protein EV361DRAFT_301166 [Lentinula raphanica]|uniref:Uncharacterized protein n=1 Tax=Lentinula raphanica TaxID=153919 RepID=A0AA38P7P4_9AGAR|nr:hypothetical protein F5880DRAFT_1711759 [Lentinula raphanica]KAJ3837591.1 hypothetical protein F5878DRAFT_622008 [Lentinula raphanica]KAJ3970146.1 hypothetical protein EV361DRAFT_301166 [Lentinula raphanica]
MADSLGISEAQLLGLFLASVFWGMLLITFVHAMQCFLWDIERGELKSASKLNWPMLIVALLLMTISTLDLSLGLMHCIEAFILYNGPGGSDARFTGLTDWVNIVRTCCMASGKAISDGVLVYRCWVVCNHSKAVVVLPVLLWLGGCSMSIFIVYLEASAGNPKVVLTDGMSKITSGITVGWTLSLVNNIITTGIIIYRIWRVDKANVLYGIQGQDSTLQGNHRFFTRKNRKRTRLQNVIRIVIESGMMYTTIAFMTFITFVVGSNSFYTTSDAELQILSMAFNLIIIRISAHSKPRSSGHSADSQFTPWTYPLHNRISAMNSGTVDTELDFMESDLSEGPTELHLSQMSKQEIR